MKCTPMNLLFAGVLLMNSSPLLAQQRVSDGTANAAINPNAILELQSNNKGLLLSRLALTATTAASPLNAHVAGMVVYNTATAGSGNTAVSPGFYYNDGTQWVRVVNAGAIASLAWIQDGNDNGALRTIGTNDNFDLPFETNGTEKMRLGTNGGLGLGTSAPASILHIDNDNRGPLYDDVWVRSYNTTGGSNTSGLYLSNARGTRATPQNLGNNDGLGNISMQGYVNGAIANLSVINATYTGNGTNLNSNLQLSTSGTTRMTLDDKGFVGINTTNPATRLDIQNGTTNGAIKIVDGTQGLNKVLTSDANGVGTWKRAAVDIYYAPIGAGVNIPSNTITPQYTGNAVTLPPGKWLVDVTMLMSKGSGTVTYTASNETWWVRTSFGNSSSSFATSPDIVGSSDLISGGLGTNSPYSIMKGSVVINNTSGGNKTYYYWAIGSMQNFNATGSLMNFGGSVWGENVITYQSIN